MTDTFAIRHPKRGKSHRSTLHPNAAAGLVGMTGCGKDAESMTERVPVEQTAPEDRCTVCFPVTA